MRSTLTLPEWAGFPRFYCATLTKPFATGMKVGYGYCTDEKWLGQMLAIKGNHDFGSANLTQNSMSYNRELATGVIAASGNPPSLRSRNRVPGP